MSYLDQQIDQLIGDALPSIIEKLQELVSIPTVNPGIDMRPAALMLADLADTLGYEVETDEVPEPIARDSGITFATNVLANYHQQSPSHFGLILNAHFDTIAPGPGWTVDPYQGLRRDGHIYGRGVMVSKADVIAYLFAPFLACQIAQPTIPVTVALTGDEEMGGYVGPARLLNTGMLKNNNVAICPGTTYQIVHEHAGVVQWKIQISGRSRHAAICERGEDANQAVAGLISRLYAHRDNDLTDGGWLTVGKVTGGVAANMVSGQATIFFDRRIRPGESMEIVREDLKTVVDQWKRTTECAITIEEVLAANPLRAHGSEGWNNWFRDKASQILGQDVPLVVSPLYTDARHFAEHGISTLCYGVGSHDLKLSGAHGVDEHILERDMMNALKVLVRVIAELWQKGPGFIDAW